MRVVEYKRFSSSNEFVRWQIEEVPEIISVQPLMMGADMELNAGNVSQQEGNFNMEIGIFVTYFTEVTK